MKINNFRGDLTDISAKKEALIPSSILAECNLDQHEAQCYISFLYKTKLTLHVAEILGYNCDVMDGISAKRLCFHYCVLG